MVYKLLRLILLVIGLPFLFFFHLAPVLSAQERPAFNPFGISDDPWVDSVMERLTFNQRIAQLFMVAAYSNRDQSHLDDLERLVRKFKVGGLIFFQGGPVRQARMTNYLQAISRTPLLVAIDGEWGLGMRLDSTLSFPRQMSLGALADDHLVYSMGREIGKQCHRLGIHVNFAPVLDVNNNPANPVINSRSFGENKWNVSRKGQAYIAGLQAERIIATGKHFPGHGDTDADSHYTLPVIRHNLDHLNRMELFPFRQVIPQGLTGMLVAHISVPSLDSTGVPTTLSKKVCTDLLMDSLKFRGLIFTDAMNMKGLADYAPSGAADAGALIAGNTVLLMPEDVHKGIRAVKKAVRRKEISRKDIDARCRLVLTAKRWTGADQPGTISLEGLPSDLNNEAARTLNRQLVASSLVLLKNDQNLIPFVRLDTLRAASVWISTRPANSFCSRLADYANVDSFYFAMGPIPAVDTLADQKAVDSLLSLTTGYNVIILGIGSNDRRPSRAFGISDRALRLVRALARRKSVVVDVFANPYALAAFAPFQDLRGLVVSFENSPECQDLSAQLLFGGIPALGRLPVTACAEFPEGSGLSLFEAVRLGFGNPLEVGMNPLLMQRIDSLALEAIQAGATPGCQILVARHGKVIYHKAFGHPTWTDTTRLTTRHVFDIASITKIAATTTALMKLDGEKRFDPALPINHYYRRLQGTRPGSLAGKEILLHQAGFTPFLPLFPDFVTRGNLNPTLFSPDFSPQFPIPIAQNLFGRKSLSDSLIAKIIQNPLNPDKPYKYSDLGFILFRYAIESITGQDFSNYLAREFYQPLGCSTLGFNPLNRVALARIVPTETDTMYRKQTLQGYVHDPAAAIQGGISGNAGLFSNAGDLAKWMQMVLNNGTYGGKRYLNGGIIQKYTAIQGSPSENRRGLGFDKPEPDPQKAGPTCPGISTQSFGHTGFTGTMVWADPDKGILYIFLSNRIHPRASNTKLVDLNIRTRIQETIYQSIQ